MKFNNEGMKPNEERVKALMALKPPTNKIELQRLLGAFNYLRQFIPDMSTLITPLRESLKKNVCWYWTETHTEVINKLKKYLQAHKYW